MARPAPQLFAQAIQRALQVTQDTIVATAKREHARVLATSPKPAGFRRLVDNREGALEEAVKADGRIVYIYQRIDMVVQAAMDLLFQLSPVDSGDYRNAHMLFVGGQAVRNLRDWKPGQEVAITNTMPYARMIEVGKMRMKVPGTDRVYWQAERILRRQYERVADINFTYRGIVSGLQVDPAEAGPSVLAGVVRGEKGRFAAGSRRRIAGGAHNKPGNRFPTLLIEDAGAVLARLRGG